MRKLACLIGAGVMMAMPWGCGDDESTGDGDDGPQGVPCEEADDCDDDNPCTFETCFTGFCEYSFNTDEAPSDQQTDGDCQVVRCQDGAFATVNDNGDEPETAGVCQVPICVDGVPGSEPAEVGDQCDVDGNTQGSCDANSVCSCALAGPGEDAYVDPVNGQDAPTNGGGPGACAYRTITYALTQDPGNIFLPPGEFTVAEETFPLVLSGTSRLRCENNDPTTLRGSGAFQGGLATIVFSGVSNQVRGCQVVGEDGGGATVDHCIAVLAASNGDGHRISDADISGCANGITVLAGGDGLRVNNNNIHDNTTLGLNVTGADKQGEINDNTWSNNGQDIACTDPCPDLGGAGNGGPSCTGCQNCAF